MPNFFMPLLRDSTVCYFWVLPSFLSFQSNFCVVGGGDGDLYAFPFPEVGRSLLPPPSQNGGAEEEQEGGGGIKM